MTDKQKIIVIGTKTKWGTIKAVGYVGERYYWIIDKYNVVSMIPASTVENSNIHFKLTGEIGYVNI